MTDKQIHNILSSMIVIVDTREKANKHILEYLMANDIEYIVEKLDSADYGITFKDPEYAPYINCSLVERKNSWNEITSNFTAHRERFKREFERISPNTNVAMVIETATWRGLFNGSYRSKMSPQSLLASTLVWSFRYRCQIWFASKRDSPRIIYNSLYYGLMTYLKTLDN